jgi:hypothetical protein
MTVTILSTFYDTSAGVPSSLVNEIKWAKAHPHIGASHYGVEGPGDYAVSAHPSTPYAVNVAAGKAWGRGVFDDSDGIETVTCAAPAAGTTRWDLICVRRNWGPVAGGPSTVTSVPGGTVRAIPGDRQNTPGTLDDQPLALVQWTAGQTQPTAIADLRCWAGNGGMLAKDELALSYLGQLGASVKIGTDHWSYELLTNDVPGWVNEDGSGPWTPLTLSAGWASNGIASVRTVGRGAFIHVAIDARYTAGSVIAEGWIIAPLPVGMRPTDRVFVPGTTNTYRNAAIYSVHAGGVAVGPFPAGTVCQLNGLAPLK